jgi:diaminopimelate epimerase
MRIDFFKYQGTGNDFVMIDNRSNQFSKPLEVIKYLCDRKFGVGSDGLICIDPHDTLDFTMDFYNPDGSQSFCGNGSRCAVAFAKFLGMIDTKTTFEAIDGVHNAFINQDQIEIHMGDVEDIEVGDGFHFMNTGSPHYVSKELNIDDLDMVTYGQSVRYNDRFKEHGTNVNVFEVDGDGVNMRTYERGVENETLSCGTGVTAVALTAMTLGEFKEQVKVTTRGGNLMVKAQAKEGGFNHIWLCGPAQQVFKGSIEL